MEIVEMKNHPFFLGTQFHPEFKSRPLRPSPPICALVAAAANMKDELEVAGKIWQDYENLN